MQHFLDDGRHCIGLVSVDGTTLYYGLILSFRG